LSHGRRPVEHDFFFFFGPFDQQRFSFGSTHILNAACQLGQRDRRGYTRNVKVCDEETDNVPNFSTLSHETSVFEDFDEFRLLLDKRFAADSISCFRTGQLKGRSEKRFAARHCPGTKAGRAWFQTRPLHLDSTDSETERYVAVDG